MGRNRGREQAPLTRASVKRAGPEWPLRAGAKTGRCGPEPKKSGHVSKGTGGEPEPIGRLGGCGVPAGVCSPSPCGVDAPGPLAVPGCHPRSAASRGLHPPGQVSEVRRRLRAGRRARCIQGGTGVARVTLPDSASPRMKEQQMERRPIYRYDEHGVLMLDHEAMRKPQEHRCPECGRSWFRPTRCGDCDRNSEPKP